MVVDGYPDYHRAGCSTLEGLADEPVPHDQAVEDGFSPCEICDPEGSRVDDAPDAAPDVAVDDTAVVDTAGDETAVDDTAGVTEPVDEPSTPATVVGVRRAADGSVVVGRPDIGRPDIGRADIGRADIVGR